MTKDAAITVRLPPGLKRRLAARARRERRSISAQVVIELERAIDAEADRTGGVAQALGLFRGTRIPSDEEFAEVRSDLGRRLLAGDG